MKFKVGDKVSWRSPGGRSIGWIKERLTKPYTIKKYTAKPTSKDPQYLVVSESGKEAVHKPSALQHEEPGDDEYS